MGGTRRRTAAVGRAEWGRRGGARAYHEAGLARGTTGSAPEVRRGAGDARGEVIQKGWISKRDFLAVSDERNGRRTWSLK